MELDLNKEYWSNRYTENQTGWDTGAITTPLKDYFDQLNNKNLRIMIPGAGNSYEAEYLFRNGFTDITVVDISSEPLANIKQRVPDFPSEKLICEDFFTLQGSYDLIVEQTFFCALSPSLREAYAEKMYSLLVKGGKLTGVLFNCDFDGGPPFGGSKDEYLPVFEKYFKINSFETCYNSIAPRSGRELFINLEKPL